jgi:hypothetical protein
MESVDQKTWLSVSEDEGRQFKLLGPLFSDGLPFHSECCKICALPDGRLAALGYAFDRTNPELPVGNPGTGGLLDDKVFVSFSGNLGKTWTPWRVIETCFGPHVEASAPLTVLEGCALASPITGFDDWNGLSGLPHQGRLLRSDDGGETWNDDAVCMEFEDGGTSCYEQRLCRLETGLLVCIGWNEVLKGKDKGKRFPNHFTTSEDNGRTFTKPQSTGVMGQASSVCAIGGSRLLALHARRRDTDRPGIYGYIVDLSNKSWDIREELIVWEPRLPLFKSKHMAEIFSFLKFGQPGAVMVRSGLAGLSYWVCEEGQYRTEAAFLTF